MPFIQRNWKGEITGLYANPQPEYAIESLPDENEEVLAFRAKNPMPLPKQYTEKERQQLTEMFDRVEKEHEAIRNAVTAFNGMFSQLELRLSTLLYAVLNVRSSQVAYAIFYSPTSFDARAEIVSNALIQIASEKEALAKITGSWEIIAGGIDKGRRIRNAIAHGSQITLAINGKNHARLTAPAFDVIRVGRKIARRQIPGLTANDINEGIKTLLWTNDCVDHVNRVISAFHDGDPSLPQKFDALTAGLEARHNRT